MINPDVSTSVSLEAALMAWWRRSSEPPALPTPANIAEAKDVLAGAVAEQWKVESTLRSLDDPDPIPVQWQLTEHDEMMDHPAHLTASTLVFAGSSDRIIELTKRFRDLRRRRLVIIGGPGAGKTTLAVQLLRQLLASRDEDEPVPVLLSIAGWDTEAFPRIHDWLGWRLRQDYPAVRATQLGDDAPSTLALQGHILPVLDGLDELPPGPARAAAITALNRWLSGEDQLILTSRTDEFTAAVREARDVLTSAAVIEAQPLVPSVVVDYLRACLPRRPGPVWEKVLTSLRSRPRSAAALTKIATTPLDLWLLRTVYIASDADPAPLLKLSRFSSAAKLRAHLFARLIPALIHTRPPTNDPAEPFRPRRHHNPDQVRRWLGYLADHLSQAPAGDGQTGTRDFAWWQLARHSLHPGTVPMTTGLVFALLGGLVAGLVFGPVFGLALGLGVVAASAIGIEGALEGRPIAWTWTKDTPGFADLRASQRIRLLVRLAAKNILGLGLVSGLLVGLVDWLVGGLVMGLNIGIVSGFVGGIIFGVAEWVETPTPEGRASAPITNWRADRTLNLTRSIVAGFGAGLVFGFGVGLGLGVQIGVGIGLILGLGFVLTGGKHHAWLAYVIATYHLAWKRRLPRRLMPFLDDAHRLGLLRAVGPIYQFRHAALQDHLAETYRSGG